LNLTDRARNLVADIDARLKQRLGRITFRAWRRGFREADLVLGPFVDQVGPTLDEGDLDSLEALLAEDDDHRLYAWIIGTEPTPPEHATPVMLKIRTFMRDHVAAAVAEGAG
jgi:antitoxin CptB